MQDKKLINQLQQNLPVFEILLSGLPEEVYRWKPTPKKWCLLEIVCHLYDEETEDFRARTKHVLETPDLPLPPIDPEGWVKKRDYYNQNYGEVLQNFLTERENSVKWLNSLQNPLWNNAYLHLQFGPLSAGLFLTNWVAHDFLHIRQITKLKYDLLGLWSDRPLIYAGEW
ncbi:MAG: DinB family protein [Sphingobacteriales bacterium]|nr:MAG: DinB family protein [Sphingobacteriales bacterium]